MSEDHSIEVVLESADARFALLSARNQHLDESDEKLIGRALVNEYGDGFDDDSAESEFRDELSKSERREAEQLRADLQIFD